jgi:hypothetical protein
MRRRRRKRRRKRRRRGTEMSRKWKEIRRSQKGKQEQDQQEEEEEGKAEAGERQEVEGERGHFFHNHVYHAALTGVSTAVWRLVPINNTHSPRRAFCRELIIIISRLLGRWDVESGAAALADASSTWQAVRACLCTLLRNDLITPWWFWLLSVGVGIMCMDGLSSILLIPASFSSSSPLSQPRYGI